MKPELGFYGRASPEERILMHLLTPGGRLQKMRGRRCSMSRISYPLASSRAEIVTVSMSFKICTVYAYQRILKVIWWLRYQYDALVVPFHVCRGVSIFGVDILDLALVQLNTHPWLSSSHRKVSTWSDWRFAAKTVLLNKNAREDCLDSRGGHA